MAQRMHTTEQTQTSATRTRRMARGPLSATDVLAVQRSAGNRAAQRLIAHGLSNGHLRAVQAKLTVGPADDAFEREADRMADAVMSSPAPTAVQREGVPEEEELQMKPLAAQIKPLAQREAMPEDEELQARRVQREAISEDEDELQTKPLAQRKGDGSFEAGADIEQRIARSKGGGSALPEATRAEMEGKFGADFSGVRVHTGSEPAQLNRDLSAQAFTHGSDVYFDEGKFAPSGSEGKRLLAHELTHVVQQTNISRKVQRKSKLRNILKRIPFLGKLMNLLGFGQSVENYAALKKQCIEEFRRVCNDDWVVEQCLEFMGNKGVDDAIQACVKRKDPNALQELLESATDVATDSYKPSGPIRRSTRSKQTQSAIPITGFQFVRGDKRQRVAARKLAHVMQQKSQVQQSKVRRQSSSKSKTYATPLPSNKQKPSGNVVPDVKNSVEADISAKKATISTVYEVTFEAEKGKTPVLLRKSTFTFTSDADGLKTVESEFKALTYEFEKKIGLGRVFINMEVLANTAIDFEQYKPKLKAAITTGLSGGIRFPKASISVTASLKSEFDPFAPLNSNVKAGLAAEWQVSKTPFSLGVTGDVSTQPFQSADGLGKSASLFFKVEF